MSYKICKISDISQEEYNLEYSLLSASRKAHIDRMKIEQDKKRSLAATVLLKKLLSERGVSATLKTAENGRPYLADSNLFVSLSHSGEFVACAVSSKRIGIDLEKLRPVKDALINRVCTEDEKAFVYSKSDPFAAFFEIWTAKEAYLKCFNCDTATALSTSMLKISKNTFYLDDLVVTIIEEA